MGLISASRRSELVEAARKLQIEFWNKRAEVWPNPPDIEGFLPLRTDLLVRHILGIDLFEPEEIPQEKLGFEVAGVVDRDLRRITIAQKFSAECRRFTTAHEIAHWVIHPEEVLHRDRPLGGHERSNEQRLVSEQEADIFAAELVMPRKQLRNYFSRAFGGQLLADDKRLELLQLLKPSLSQRDLASKRRLRSMLVAEANSLGSSTFLPLHRRFGVSGIAMAIQLEELALVE